MSNDTLPEPMIRAFALARGQSGKVAPNPAVGCVIVADGQITGAGATQAGGRPHAEAVALAMAGSRARGAHVYVTLEPCAHRSERGPSCAVSLIDAGIASCTIAMQDPDPRTAGKGVAMLEAAGVGVVVGPGAEEATTLYAGFAKRLATGRPLLAIDADPTPYDAAFSLGFRETFEEALDRLGAEGMTNVHVLPGTPLAGALLSRGLVDRVISISP